jgi:MFS family permease
VTEIRAEERSATVAAASAWGVLAVVTGALFLEGIDIAMLNVAVPSIAADIGLAEGSAHWVISAYVLAYAGFMILGGRAADLLGRRRVFLVALAVFVLFSALGGLAQESWVLILVRFITGATAGFMTPAGFGLLTASFPEGPRRNKALAIYGAIGASGFLLGVVVGGLLTTVGWRWVFFAPAVIGTAFLITGLLAIPKPLAGTRDASGRFDAFGAVTLTAAMVTLVFGIVSVGEEPGNPLGLVALVAGIVLFILFGVIERRVSDPLIPPGVLGKGLLPWSSLVGLLFIGAFFSWQFLLTLYLQQLLGWGPLETGLTFAAMGVEVVIAPWLTPWLVGRFGNAPVMVAGLVAVAIAFTLTLGLDGSTGFLDLLASLLLLGIAFALIYGPLTAAAVEGVDDAAHGVAGGVVYTGFQFGAALGVSAATIALVAGTDGPAALGDYQRALIVPAVAAGLALTAGIATLVRRRSISKASA